MIPIRSLLKDVGIALSVVVFSVGVLLLNGTTTPGTIQIASATPIPTIDSVTMPATVIIPSLPPEIATTSTTTLPDTSTTTPPTTSSHPKTPTHSLQTTAAAPKKAIVTKPTRAPVPSIQSDAAYMAEITRLINVQTNTFRKANKLTTLTLDTTLTQNATAYSRTLLAGHFLSHTDKKGCDMTCRFTRDGYTNAWAWGENLATLHFSDRPTAEYVASYFMQAWKKSAGHRENLLTASYTHTGIGVSMDSHSIYVTVQFSDPK